MRVLWRQGRASVEQVRQALPSRRRSAYTTVQTVLNRLAERGLLRREKVGNLIVYSPQVNEVDYLSRSLNETLAQASEEARLTALANLVGDLEPAELDEIRGLAEEVRDRRKGLDGP